MRLLGVEIGDGELRLAHGEQRFGSVRLTGLERVSLDAASAAARGATAQVLGALPLAATTHRILALPFRDRRRLARVVPLELLGQLPVEPDDARVAFTVLRPHDAGTAVLAAVARQAQIDALTTVLAGLGAPPTHLNVAPLPAWNLVPVTLGDAALVIADGARSCVSLRRAGRVHALRALDASPATPDAFVATLRWALAVGGGIPPTVVVAGADASDALGSALKRWDTRVVGLDEVSPDAAPGTDIAPYAVAAGLVLGAGARASTALAFPTGRRPVLGSLRPAAALATAAVALAMIDWGIARHDLVRREATLAAAIRAEAAAVLPGAPLIAPRLELEAAANAGGRRALFGGTGGTLALLRELSTRIPATVRPDLDQLAVEPDALTLHGRADTFDTVEGLRRALTASPLLADVTADETRTTVDGRQVEFRLRATRRPPGGAAS